MPGFEAWARNRIEAPALDLSGGFAAYQARLAERQGVKVAGVFKSVLGQAKRRMEREIGPVRFVDRDESPAALDALFRWKSAQWQRTVGMQTDRFATPWVRGFVSDLSRSRVADLEGCLSTLYVGDRIVAVHLGLRSGAMMHSWFPAYDIDMATYSPGMYLLLETARAASEKGVTELDLGRGVSPYKSRVMTHSRTVLIGDASSPAWLGHGLRRVHLLRDASRAALRPWWRAAKGLRGRPGVAAASGEDV
jgi:CelD/BcsL family acetyltransferase involved in cellulose biosynthesis